MLLNRIMDLKESLLVNVDIDLFQGRIELENRFSDVANISGLGLRRPYFRIAQATKSFQAASYDLLQAA